MGQQKKSTWNWQIIIVSRRKINKQNKRVCRDERRILYKNLYSTTPGTVTPILHDLKWLTLEKRRKVTLHTIMFKVVSGLSAIQFPPYILFKRRQGTRWFHPKKFIQVGANTNKYNQFYCRYNHRLELLTKWCHTWKAVSRRLSKRPTCAIFKNADAFSFF